MPTTANTIPVSWIHGACRKLSGDTTPANCRAGAKNAAAIATTKPTPANHSTEPTRPLMP